LDVIDLHAADHVHVGLAARFHHRRIANAVYQITLAGTTWQRGSRSIGGFILQTNTDTRHVEREVNVIRAFERVKNGK
jgi:hypothetical protein